MKQRRASILLSMLLPVVLIAAGLMAANTIAATGEGATGLSPSQTTTGPLILPDADLIDDGGTQTTAATSHRLIVQLESPPLVEWSEKTGLSRTAEGRLDPRTPEAQAYITQLEAEQAAFINAMNQALPEASVAGYINEFGNRVEATYQVVFNGVAVDPGAMSTEVARRELAKLPGVKAVFLDFKHQPTLYASLPLINAPAAWNNPVIGGQANAGAGVKVASMDGGLHHDAPMFDGTGYSYPSGFPPGGLGDAANNNGKIIASRAYFRDFDPPAPGDENTWPGENGTSHGTHTGSTAAGNPVVADYLGITETISGVAPSAWVMSYRVFYASVLGDASFHTVEGIAALEDIVMDGADVLNNSWGGGPGSVGGEFDPLDMALINAANAGVFISMSAGNAGPGNGTTDHPSDEYIVVGASTTSGTLAAGRLSVIAPQPVSPTLQDMSYSGAEFGAPLPVGAVITHTFISAASVDPGNVTGCSPWTGTPFAGSAALISRGGCFFADKVYYAEQAGAEFVIIYNNAGDGLITMACGGNFCDPGEITISSIFIGQTNGEEMVAWHATYGSASVLEVNTLAFQTGNTPDLVINFSSRGPGVGNVLKPDILAPGVNILAQGYTPGASGEARHLGYGQASGTSMSAPHVAGAAALLRQIHPTWSNADIKSALMSTSKYIGIFNQDGTPSQPLDMGAGRLDLTNAADPGVLLDPPSVSFGMVPTGTTKTLTVTVTSVATSTQTYSISTWLMTGSGFVVTPTSPLPGFSTNVVTMTLAPGASAEVAVTFDPAASMGIGDNQGYILMESADYEAHMPAWARVTPPPAAADVLIIDNDFSYLLGFPDYRSYYTSTLEALGLTYDIWHADAFFAHPTTIPDAATLSAYKMVIYYTGDNFYPDGTFTVSTPPTELDMNRLTEYANNGGIVIAMGQDLASVFNSTDPSNAEFFYEYVLGGKYLQDSVTGFSLPDLPVGPLASGPPAFDGIQLDLSGPNTTIVALTGANEVPPVATTTQGRASFSYDAANRELSYGVALQVSGTVTVTAAHIHSGTAGVNGPPIFPIFPFTTPQVVTDTLAWNGMVTLNITQEAQMLSGGMYVNVHSTANPAGEVRGQVRVNEISGDGAANQYYIDEIARNPSTEQGNPPYLNPYRPLLRYPGPYNLADGVVAMAHRDQPSLERPGISYYGRSIYTTFGLEGVNNGVSSTERDEFLGALIDWAMDEPTVTISDVTGTYSDTTYVAVFEAQLASNITGTTGVLYRWDFGDGSGFAGPYTSNQASHHYAVCGPYTVRVEVTDSWGNRAIGSLDVLVTEGCEANLHYLPFVAKP